MCSSDLPYRTRDGYIAVMPYTSQQWTRFMECVGHADLLQEDWVKDPVKRSANVDALYQVIADAAPSKTTAEWLKLLKENDIPCGPVNSLDDLFNEPHLRAVELFQSVTHPSEGAMTNVRSAFRVPGMKRKADRLAPRIGEGGEDILREAGYSAGEIKTLIARRIVRVAS